MKHIFSTLFTFLLLMSAAVPARADFAVTSITLSANDLDASAYFPVMDNYKRQCALIKVQVDPPQGGFTFETGSLGVEKVVEKLPEIWVYVPEKTMKIKIMHPKLGVISNSQNNDGYYWFHDKVGKLESGRVYVLKLALDKQVVENIVEVKKRSGFLILNTVPEGAEVYLGPEGGKLEYENVTPFSKKLEYGRYNFRVKKAKYHDDFGLAIINTPQLEYDLQLKPAFGSIDVTSTPAGAQVFLDGENTGKVTPCTLTEVDSGEHDVRVMMLNYSPQSSTVTVKDEQTSSVALVMDARFAQVTITSLPGASIKINGEAKDTSSYTENLIEGLYDIEVTLSSHRPTAKQIEVVAGVPQSVELTPTPIYGSLDVISQPMKADITINGKNYGYTPTTIENILIGEYDVVLSKEGCATVTEHVSISENSTASINATLPSGRSVTIATDKDGDEIFVDGVKVGVSPCTTELAFGSHEFTAQRGTKRMSKNVSISQDESAHAVRLDFGMINLKWSKKVTPSQRIVLEKLIANMVKVEGGTFWMGSSQDDRESPCHQVTLSSYYIGKYEVTQEEWVAVMEENPSHFKGSNKPVENVSWKDCQKFIKKLNSLTGLTFSLPTEAQWEYAARRGNERDGMKHHPYRLGDSTHEVGTYKPNKLGLYDMIGNVWEWCYGKSVYYSREPQTNPLGTKGSGGKFRVLRGGCWHDLQEDVWVTKRECESAGERWYHNDLFTFYGIYGLRLALNITE